MDEFTKNLFAHLDKSREAQTILDTLDEVRVALEDAMEALPDDHAGTEAWGQAQHTLRTIDNTAYEVNRNIYLGELTA